MTESQQLELFNAPDPSLALVENEHTPKHRAEANSVGLTLLSKSARGANYRRYRFDACGHIAEIATASVRKNKFSCKACRDSRHRAEASSVGLTLLSKSVKNHLYRRYRFNACGHEDDIQTGNVREGKFACKACLDSKHRAEANSVGLNLISESAEGANYRRYELPCGHITDITIRNVREGQFSCKACLDSKHRAEAEDRGIQLIGKSQRGTRFRRYLLACGCETDIRIGCVRTGYFACPTCGDHSWTKPSQVYLIEIDPVDSKSFLKFGYAKNVKERIAKYGLPENAAHKVLKTVDFKTRKEACEFEQTAHHVWKDKKIEPTCSMKSGSTECYPLDWCQTIMQAMEAATQP